MVDTFRANRQFERFIFHGVPERPEPTWERDSRGSFEGRYSGKSHVSSQDQEYDLSEDEIVATLIYDSDSQTVTVVYPGDRPSTSGDVEDGQHDT